GGTSGRPELKPYTFDDVVSALNGVAPSDWRAFLNRRVNSTDPNPPFGGIEASGWRLVYNDKPNVAMEAQAKESKQVNFYASLGLALRDNGAIVDVIPGSPAARANIAPNARIVAVNGRRYSQEGLGDVLKASPNSNGPIELIIESGDYF